MKGDQIKNLAMLSKKMKDHLSDEFYNHAKRKRLTSLSDGFIFRLLYGQIKVSQDLATAKMNKFKSKKTNTVKLRRSSYADRDNGISIKLYEDIFRLIDDHVIKNFTDPSIKRIFAVDGTHSHLQKNLQKDGFTANIYGEAVDGLTMGIYDVVNNFPEIMKLVSHKK